MDYSRLHLAGKPRTIVPRADKQWQVTPAQAALMQQMVQEEFTAALTAGGAFTVVDRPEQAQVVVGVALQSIRAFDPGARGNGNRRGNGKGNGNGNGRGGIDASGGGAPTRGAITASLTALDRGSGATVLRALETRTVEDVRAFYQIADARPAVSLLCRAWGDSLRRGMLDLRRRSQAPSAPASEGTGRGTSSQRS